jgi:hypothetical protein
MGFGCHGGWAGRETGHRLERQWKGTRSKIVLESPEEARTELNPLAEELRYQNVTDRWVVPDVSWLLGTMPKIVICGSRRTMGRKSTGKTDFYGVEAVQLKIDSP